MSQRTLCAFALGFSILAGFAPSAKAQGEVVERVVAVVNEEAIFLSDLRRRSIPLLDQVMGAPSAEERMAGLRQLYTEMLERLIDEELIKQAARRMQVRVTNADIRRTLQNVIQQNNLTEEEFWQAVSQQGYTEAQYRSDLRRQLLRLKVINTRVRGRVNITEEDVRREYDNRTREVNRQLRFRTSHVFLEVPASATATEVAEIRARAAALRQGLSADNFEDAVDEYGGGELGWLREGDLPGELEEALAGLRAGEISEPVQGHSGIHILLLHERERGSSDVPSYEQMREPIYQEMLGRAMQRQEQLFLEELRRRALIRRQL